MPQALIDLLNKAAEACIADKFRTGNMILLPLSGSLIATGDLHGHRRNFERIAALADLANNPKRHIIFQEIIHGGAVDSEQNCVSYKLLFDIARYKLEFPEQVHIIMGNHDTAFICDAEVMKDGKEMNRSMRLALDREFNERSEDIKDAISDFLFSLPLAGRCDNRIWLSHSLPTARTIGKFDKTIFDRPITSEDMCRDGSVYLLTWGRNHSQAILDELAELLDVDVFVLGHQAQAQGWSQAGQNLVIIASDHNHGCLLPIDLEQVYDIDRLVKSIVPLASLL